MYLATNHAFICTYLFVLIYIYVFYSYIYINKFVLHWKPTNIFATRAVVDKVA